jgi:hypothetical protein
MEWLVMSEMAGPVRLADERSLRFGKKTMTAFASLSWSLMA